MSKYVVVRDRAGDVYAVEEEYMLDGSLELASFTSLFDAIKYLKWYRCPGAYR